VRSRPRSSVSVFAMTLITNVSFDEMRRGLIALGRDAAGADMAAVYLAGHCMEIGGENWLIPVDAELKGIATRPTRPSRAQSAPWRRDNFDGTRGRNRVSQGAQPILRAGRRRSAAITKFS
jgi:hypothetical protein